MFKEQQEKDRKDLAAREAAQAQSLEANRTFDSNLVQSTAKASLEQVRAVKTGYDLGYEQACADLEKFVVEEAHDPLRYTVGCDILTSLRAKQKA